MSVKRSWKVYGAEGHRQRISFGQSFRWDFSSEEEGVRIIEVDCEDRTGTNDYVVVHITRDTADACEREFQGQLTDGLFESSRYGDVEEVTTA